MYELFLCDSLQHTGYIILCPELLMLTSLAIVALGTVNFISRGTTGSHDVGRSLTGGPFLEPARRNVAEFDLSGGGGGAYIYNNDIENN